MSLSESDSSTSLAALPRERLIDRATEAIKDYIIANRLQSNDRLPTELEFAQKLAVSRNVVRQALASLEAVGIVRTEHGRGSFVAEAGAAARILQHLAFWLDIQHLDQANYFETRRIFDAGILELAMQRATDEDVEQLGVLVETMRATRGAERYASHDAFHLALFETTGNVFLSSLGIILSRFFWQVAAVAPSVEPVSEDELPLGHQAIVDGLRRRDPSRIPDIVAAHLRPPSSAPANGA